MRILVTGGAGFIASHVADGFIAAGHTVAVLDDLSTGFRKNVSPAAAFYHGDVRDAEYVRKVFAEFKPNVVDHHAAQMDVRKSLEDPVFDAECNIVGMINIILAAIAYGTQRIVYASTGGAVYGEPKKLPVTEDHTINPECAYGISKHTAEHYLELYRILNGLKYVVLRYPNVFGPRQNPHGEAGVNAIFIGLMLEGKVPTIFGDGKAERDYVFVSDIVDANLRALTKGDNQIINVGSGVGTSVNQIFKQLSDIIGFNKPAIYAPARPGEIQRVFLDATKAKTLLGWQPTVTFAEGQKQTVEWHQAEKA
jgi:UDP-glucose 4-epimerase